MIALLQRVRQASVAVEDENIASIGAGLLVFIAVKRGDSAADAGRMAERVLTYRVFSDAAGRMNHSLLDTRGELLLVPQFTLAADTRKGTRASFTPAAEPDEGRRLFECVLDACRKRATTVASGRFGAAMQVSLINDGPVTFWLET